MELTRPEKPPMGSGSQEFSSILWILKIHYRDNESPRHRPLAWSRWNQTRSPNSNFSKAVLISSHARQVFPSGFLSTKFPHAFRHILFFIKRRCGHIDLFISLLNMTFYTNKIISFKNRMIASFKSMLVCRLEFLVMFSLCLFRYLRSIDVSYMRNIVKT
jgi:hypothetical protein